MTNENYWDAAIQIDLCDWKDKSKIKSRVNNFNLFRKQNQIN